MRHGFFMGYGNGGMIILAALLFVAAVVITVFLSEHFRKRNHPEHNRLLEILKEKYGRNEISADEYRERSMILDDEYWMNSNNLPLMALKEQYARCEIDSQEYVNRRDEFKEGRSKSAMDILKERYARGEISQEEFYRIKKDIQ